MARQAKNRIYVYYSNFSNSIYLVKKKNKVFYIQGNAITHFLPLSANYFPLWFEKIGLL